MLNIETIEVNFNEDGTQSSAVIFQDGSVVIDQNVGGTAVVLSLEALDLLHTLASDMVDYTDDSGYQLPGDVPLGCGCYETGDIEDLNDPYDGIDGEDEDSGFNS